MAASEGNAQPPLTPSVHAAAGPPSGICRHIVQQLDGNLDEHKASGDAFVVSVYGEWGIGKTHCLRELYAYYDGALQAAIQRNPAPKRAKLVVPVSFEA